MIGEESEEASTDWKSHGPLTQLQESLGRHKDVDKKRAEN